MDSSLMVMSENKIPVKIGVRRAATKTTPSPRCDHARLLFQNYANYKRSSVPARIMFFENGSWVDYPSEIAEVMKSGFGDGMPAVEAQFRGRTVLFDFYRMLEIELESGNRYRSISWIDVDGKCFFPKVFVSAYDHGKDVVESVDFDENCAKIKIDIQIGEDSASSQNLKVVNNKTVNLNNNKRKREENVDKENVEGGGSSNINEGKKRQMCCASESQSARWPKTRVLGVTAKGYAVVKKLFISGLERVDTSAEVTALHKCVRTGPVDKARYQMFDKQIEITKQARGESNVAYAWYGTSAKGVESILNHGFGMPDHVSHRGGHGVGIYLSPIRSPDDSGFWLSAMQSGIDENGENHVMLCRVILGKCEKVEAGSGQSHPSSVDYDTGVDDWTNPKWYIVWQANMNTHIIPECIVSYRLVNVSGTVNGVSSVNRVTHPSFLIAKLIAKLKSSLPLRKMQEIARLCGLYKEGKLGRDIFLRQLRSVVGDDLLRSAIQEIRG